MRETFGSASLFYRMREAWQARDEALLAELLTPHVEAACAGIAARRFPFLSFQDREDVRQEVMLKVLSAAGRFLEDPGNAPAAGDADPSRERAGWLYRIAFNAFCDRGRKMKREEHDSLDQPVSGQEDSRTLGSVTPSRERTPEERAVLKERLEEACRELFSLPNDPEVLAAVGFVILRDALEREKTPLETYAAAFRQLGAADLADRMERMLRRREIDPAVLEPLRKRIRQDAPSQLMRDMTAKKLANRKNGVLTALRKRRGDAGKKGESR